MTAPPPLTCATQVGQVRKLCGLPATPGAGVTLVLLDIPDNGGYYVQTVDDASSDVLKTFLNAPGDRKQLS